MSDSNKRTHGGEELVDESDLLGSPSDWFEAYREITQRNARASPLLALPYELREQIFSHVFEGHLHVRHAEEASDSGDGQASDRSADRGFKRFTVTLSYEMMPFMHPHPASCALDVSEKWRAILGGDEAEKAVETFCTYCAASPVKQTLDNGREVRHPLAFRFTPFWTASRQLVSEVQPYLPKHLASCIFSFGTSLNLWTYVMRLPPLWELNITKIWLSDVTQGESVLNHLFKNNKLRNLREAYMTLKWRGDRRKRNYANNAAAASVVRRERAMWVATVENLARRFEKVNVRLVVYDKVGSEMTWRAWVKETNAAMAEGADGP